MRRKQWSSSKRAQVWAIHRAVGAATTLSHDKSGLLEPLARVDLAGAHIKHHDHGERIDVRLLLHVHIRIANAGWFTSDDLS